MKSLRHILILLSISLGLASCGVMAPQKMVPQMAILSSKPDLSKYKYVYITPTPEKSSVTGGTYGNQYGVYGSTTSKSIIPSDVIAGSFMKHGFVRIPEINDAQKAQTIVVNYGESGRKNYGLLGAYSIEVTIQLLDATTYELICSSTAEGMGATETDDVREATLKCLNAIFQ